MASQDDPQTPKIGEPHPQAAPDPTNAASPTPPVGGDISVILTPGKDAKDTIVGQTVHYTKLEVTDPEVLRAALSSGQANVELVASLVEILARRPEPNTPRPPAPENMPGTDAEVGEWFRTKLTQAERCQVRATAILHGAPAHLVNDAAHELLNSLRQPGYDRKDEPLPKPSEEDLGSVIIERAFVSIRRSEPDGARRVYWKDADDNGYSEFGQRVLRLLAHELEGSDGFRSENSRALINTWATRPQGDLAVRAANALGAIHWDSDPNDLAEKMRLWAMSANAAERRGAPLLAVGAFAAEWGQRTEHSESAPTNLMTQRMLDKMSYRAVHNEALMPQAVAVSAAFSLIGLKWTSQALDGLDYLLGLDVTRGDDMPDSIPFTNCFPAFVGYMQLAAAGFVRPTIARLGIRARMLTTRPQTGITGEASRKEKRRKDRLLNVHLAFFFILFAATPPTARKWAQYGEKERIEDRPKFNEHRDGRDVLLDGVLSEGESDLCLDVQSLLWSSLASDTRELARETLRRWLEAIAIASPDEEGTVAVRGQAFFVSLEARVRAWDAAAGLAADPKDYTAPSSRYRWYMDQWATVAGNETRQAVGRLAKRIVRAFPPL